MSLRHAPNLVTFARLVVAVGVFAALERAVAGPPGPSLAMQLAFWGYLAAAASDSLDGWLARRYRAVTALGRVADPVVDKVLTLGAMAYLIRFDAFARPDDPWEVMPVWAYVVLLAREFLVTALRGFVESRGLAFPAERLGKWKMVLQTIYVCIALGAAGGVPATLHLPFLDHLRDPVVFFGVFLAMIALTLVSGATYLVRGWRLLNGGDLTAR